MNIISQWVIFCGDDVVVEDDDDEGGDGDGDEDDVVVGDGDEDGGSGQQARGRSIFCRWVIPGERPECATLHYYYAAVRVEGKL